MQVCGDVHDVQWCMMCMMCMMCSDAGELKAFAIERSARQGCSLSLLLYVLALEPLLRRLRDEKTNPSLRGVPFAVPLTARVSAFADDITVFVSRRVDIKAVKKAVD